MYCLECKVGYYKFFSRIKKLDRSYAKIKTLILKINLQSISYVGLIVKDVYYPKCDLNLSRINRIIIKVLSSYCNSPKKNYSGKYQNKNQYALNMATGFMFIS